MANERDDEQFGKQDETGQDKQQPPGQQAQKPEFGQQGETPNGSQGQSSSGQADLGTGGDTDTLSTEKDFGEETGGSQTPAGTGGEQDGFVGSQGTGSSDYLQEDSTKSDFATEGQGALENPDEDIETGQIRSDNDIEGGTGV